MNWVVKLTKILLIKCYTIYSITGQSKYKSEFQGKQESESYKISKNK